MEDLTWQQAVETVEPHVVKILTPRGSGTGFLCVYARNKELCGIATAAHVISHSHQWEEPIRIKHYVSGKTVLLRERDRAIYINTNLDTAVILFVKGELPLPSETLKFIPEKKHLRIGNTIGWVGFPAVSPENLCFFTGAASCWLEKGRTYLVDGVAINGVSGGPAFRATSKGVKVIGSVSAYLPNRAVGTPLPGLSMISDVEHYQLVIKKFKDLDEARKKETPPEEVAENKNTEEGSSDK
ncbi:MAG: serine protease [Candidatus Altiarchaeales archaeon]|nr:serine protease [Candidatus Altiarchaeales archaeon]